MKSLQDILYKVALREVSGDTSREIKDFFFDSREVGADCLFVAIPGTLTDGHKYIPAAVEAGAAAVVCEVFPEHLADDVVWIRVDDAQGALAHIAANFYDNPAEELKIVGITGTNGKTTTATLLFELFSALGYPSGLFSTVSIRIGTYSHPTRHTTPDPKVLHSIFREMVDAGCEYCFMEVSSHSLDQKRVEGIPFHGGVFTNISHDHLDYHKTFQDYLKAKQKLFDNLNPQAFSLTNLDDRNGQIMVQNTKANRRTYGVQHLGDYHARIVENTFQGLLLEINDREVWFRLVGSFNAYNLLAAFGTAMELGQDEEEVLLELSKIGGVDGRFESVPDPAGKVVAIVDYAHTPDALQNVLSTIRDIHFEGGRLITVVGCGGDRDQEKRPEMARISSEYSDLVLLTSDNPRNEDPNVILDQMLAGVPVSQKKKVLRIENRKDAISAACRMAQASDVILVAGKGHETYQEIKGVKHPFDDRQVLLETFKLLNY